MKFGRLVHQVDGDQLLFIRRTWLTKFFVAGDVISFLIQAAGGGIEAGKGIKNVKTGSNIIVAGLFIQIIFFGLFVMVSLFFDHRFRKHQDHNERVQDIPYRRLILSIYVISILIFVRSIVRVVEFLQGFGGFITRYEAFLYVFDGLLMWFAMVVALTWYSGDSKGTAGSIGMAEAIPTTPETKDPQP
jgi:hypothetical protein